MDLKRIFSSTVTYVVLLIAAIAVLLLTASMGYKQIKGLQKSADMVSHTLETDRSINNLFSHYLLMEAETLRAIAVRDTARLASWKSYVLQNDVSYNHLRVLLEDNPTQLKRLERIDLLRDTLFSTFTHLDMRFTDERITTGKSKALILKITGILDSIKSTKNAMVLEEQALLQKRKDDYQKEVLFTPHVSYLMALFSLGIFVFSFRKINRDKNRMVQTESFLKNILTTTNHIINHFEPIYSKKGEIVDFRILFTNDRITEVTGDVATEILGKLASEVYPFLMENNIFEIWKECVEKQEIKDYQSTYVFHGERMWFSSTVIPLKNGITVTTRNNTNERISQEKQTYLNNQLQIQNSILNQIKNIAKIGSYRWYLETGTMEFSDNLYRLLGHEPKDFAPTMENYMAFIHPEDRDLFRRNVSEIGRNLKIKDFSYRVTTKDGKEKHFFSKYQILEKEGGGILIAVIQDVTKEKSNKLKLKGKNLELKRSNAELQSFNRVASHDLQEPLRKIQIFISRINDSEVDRLTDRGKEYFNKINTAASRMQSLIRYLLTYSRVNDGHKEFEYLDLNSIIEKVQEDQAVTIMETGTELVYKNLPVITGIRFQMEQLFNNLVSNSIKYGPIDGHPFIRISTELHTVEEKDVELFKTGKVYFKISIEDNGIGFNPEYAEKIFELFQRLHAKNQYSGSGIGLAICKKIVENHNGYIRATSIPGKGSTFIIFLPV
ncbi:MAG: ATP-binding protein [Sediminicola sp.]|tara:strand:- start:14473 stop:16638 length:2166 start_codon:yes stop_codon:yes gene_type:complete